MAKKKAVKKKLPKGRPTKYSKAYDEQVYKLCLLGAVDLEISDFFDVSESTLNLWKLKYPSFKKAMRDGKIKADADVAHALFQRAVGYEHDDVHIAVSDGSVIQTPITKIYAPDTKAALAWLQIRQLTKWKMENNLKISGDLGLTIAGIMEEIDGKTADLPRLEE